MNSIPTIELPQQAKKACDFCRRRKIKCSGGQICNPCVRMNEGNCTYDAPILKRGPKGTRTRSVSVSNVNANNHSNSTFPNSPAGLLFHTSSDPSNTSSPNLHPRMNNTDSNSSKSPGFLTPSSPFMNHEAHSGIFDNVPASSFTATDSTHSEAPTFEKLFQAISASAVSLQATFDQPPAFQQNFSTTMFGANVFQAQIDNSYTGLSPLASVPDREQLSKLNNYPLTDLGIDFVKLVLFLGDLPGEKLNTAQVQAVVNYFQHFHTRVPILDFDPFIYFLTQPFNKYMMDLLNDLQVLHKLSTIDLSRTDTTLYEVWMRSLDNYYPEKGNLGNPFHLTMHVLDQTIARLAVLLL